jgi:hypothetical protein
LLSILVLVTTVKVARLLNRSTTDVAIITSDHICGVGDVTVIAGRVSADDVFICRRRRYHFIVTAVIVDDFVTARLRLDILFITDDFSCGDGCLLVCSCGGGCLLVCGGSRNVRVLSGRYGRVTAYCCSGDGSGLLVLRDDSSRRRGD